MKRNYNKIIFSLISVILIIFIIVMIASNINPQIKSVLKNTFNNKEAATNTDVVDPTQWVAVDGLGRTLDTNEETGDIKSDKEVGIFFWNWHDTETVMYRRDKASTKDPNTAFNTFENVEPYNIQNAIDKYPNENPLNINSKMWENHQGYMWWNKPIYGYYRNSDKWVLRRQVELLADAGIDFILLDYTNTSGTGESFKNQRDSNGCYVKSEETGSRKPYWENRFSYCWDWRPLFEVFSEAKKDGINVPKIGFMLSFTDQDKYAPSPHGGQKGNNEMLLCLYDNLYKPEKYKDLWYYRDNKPFLMSYEPVINENDATFKKDFSAADINELKSIKNMFTFRNPGDNNVGSVLDVAPKQNGWAWESMYPQFYGKSGSVIEEVPVSPAQNVGYDENGNYVGTPMNFDNSRGRDMPRDDNFLSRLSSFEKKHSNFTGDYTYLYKGKEVNVNSSTNNSYLYGRNFQQQWDRAISLDPKVILLTGWNEWVVVRNPHEDNVNKFVDEFNDLKSRDIEPSAGKLKDHYYYQMVENIRKFKGTNKLPNQTETKTIDLDGDINQWNDANIINYNHYTFDDLTIYRSTKAWGSPDTNAEYYSNYTSIEGNDLKKAKVSYDKTNVYFYIECNTPFRDYGIDRTRLLIDTIDSENSTSTKNWEEYEYILNRNNATENTLKLERSKGGWNWEEVGQVEYTTADSEGHGNNVLQVKIPRKYLGLTSENVKFNFKWIDNNVTDENGTTADIMNVYTDGDAAPGGRFAFAFTGNASYEEETYTINLNANGGTVSESQITYKESTATFTLPTPTRKGYTFRGWTGTGLSKVTQEVTIPKGSTGDRTYKANWSKDEYTITYTLNGGTTSEELTTVYQVDTETFTLPTPTKKGYTFMGWTGTDLTEETQEVTIAKGSTGHREYVANWSLSSYAITYNLDGGTITGQKTSYNITTATFTLPKPTKKGYIFTGWTGTGLTEPTETVTIPKGSTGKRTYTANWKIETYTITYNLGGGEIAGQKTSYNVTTATFTLPIPTKTGYTFTGWTGTGITTPTKTVKVTKGSIGNKEYTANWEKQTYVIEYNLDGGEITGQKTTYDVVTESFTLPTPTKTGYTFIGWTGTDLEEPTKTVTIAKGSTGDREYTANWSAPTSYSITYNLDGGTITGQKTSYNITTATFTLPTPTKKGYIFTGWTGTGLAEPTETVTIAKGSTGKRTYTANWKIETYTIKYNLDGGTITGQKTSYNVTTATFTLPIPTKTGYTFKGWTGTGLTTPTRTVKVTKGSIGNKEYTANWEKETYEIVYNLDGGEISGQKNSYDIDTATFTLPTPTKTGYTFIGWTGTDLEEPTNAVTIAKGSTGDREYTANWSSATSYTITYNLNGGKITGQKTSYNVDTETFTLPTPTRKGYTFTGWTGTGLTEPTKTVTVAKGSTGNRSYKANWSKNTYTITYSLDGGEITEQNDTYQVDTATFILPTPTKTGYVFIGWTGTDLEEATATVTIAKGSIGNRAYTANWIKEVYTITYNLNDGEITGQRTGYQIDTESFTLPTPTKEGYTFEGWTGTGLTEPTKAVTISKGSTGDREYTANWSTATSYTITYNLNGGKITGQKTTYNISTATFTLPTPTRKGYTFTGWTGTDLEEATKTVTITKGSTGNRSYKANWSKNTYTITYSLDGGEITEQNDTYQVDTATFILPTPTKTGYVFIGWTGTDLEEATETVTIAKGSIGNREYIANWQKEVYTITYNLNNGTISGQRTGYQMDTETFTLPTPTKEGYTFAGWTGTGLTEPTETVTIAKGSTGNREYTANWSRISYSIKYNLNGGTITGQKTSYNIETKTFTLPIPTKEGYVFTGWTGTGLTESAKTVTIAKGSMGNRVYTANWSKGTYKITYNLNEGEITGQKETYEADTETFTLPTPTRKGYTFEGWTGTGLSEATKTVKVTKGSTGDREYTANWNIITYTITYNLNEGNIQGEKTLYQVNTKTYVLPTPTREGYIFEGWTGTDLEEATKTVTIAKGSIGNREYTANWSEKIFNIKEYKVEGNFVERIKPNTQYKDLIKNIETNLEYTIEDEGKELGGQDIIKTGQEIVVENRTYKLVVSGDTNGDGKVDIKDILQLNKHRLNKVKLENEFYMAGNVNEDEKLDIKDILKLNKYRLNKITEL
ncbi:MAG: InlB B-repeat-containing protein [Clostridia bacterium]|nr:InlB B-repeat-containing protein [Clostridia bacterium]